MNENITIIDKNNNGILAEGIAYIQFPTIGKKYVIYTLNEIVKNNLNKIYVGEVGETAGTLNTIPDEDWKIVREALTPINVGNPIEGVECLAMKEATFIIGIPKKLAISDLAKQTLRSFYVEAMATKIDTSSNEPAVAASEPTPQFFNPEGVLETTTPEVTESAPMVNIFDTPMTPMAEENASDKPTIMPQPAITNTEVKIIPETPVTTVPMVQSSVTKEEALRALEIITRYIKGDGDDFVKTDEKKEDLLEVSASAISLMDELSENNSQLISNTNEPILTSENNNSQIPAMETVVPNPLPPAIEPSLDMPALNSTNGTDINAIPNTQIIDMDALDDFETMEMPAPVQNTNYVANNNGAALPMGVETPSALGSQVVLPNNYMNQPSTPSDNVFGPGSLPTE